MKKQSTYGELKKEAMKAKARRVYEESNAQGILSGPTTDYGHVRAKHKTVAIGHIELTANGSRQGKGIQITQDDGKSIRLYLSDADLLRLAALAVSGVTGKSWGYLAKFKVDGPASYDNLERAACLLGEFEL